MTCIGFATCVLPHLLVEGIVVGPCPEGSGLLILGFGVPLRPPALVVGLDGLAEVTSVQIEVARLQSLYEHSLRSAGGTALVELVHAYYGLAQLDGFRTAYWLGRALETSSQMAVLPPAVSAIRRDLAAMVATTSGAGQRAGGRELYTCFQAVADHLTPLLKVGSDALDVVVRFAVQMPIDLAALSSTSEGPR